MIYGIFLEGLFLATFCWPCFLFSLIVPLTPQTLQSKPQIHFKSFFSPSLLLNWLTSLIDFLHLKHLLFISYSSFVHPHSTPHTSISIEFTFLQVPPNPNLNFFHFSLHIAYILSLDNFLLPCSKILSFSENKFFIPHINSHPNLDHSKTYQSTRPIIQYHLCFKYIHTYISIENIWKS